MPANFTHRQLAFYRELFAPFAPGELSEKPGRGGKTFTFIDKRALMNRLDSVCGPNGWYPEYRQFGPGLICALTILCPDVTEAGVVRVTKEDGAGPEEMSEVDNDIKSNFTNALRRTAQDAWGIGRYLYGKGIPSFLDPNASALPKVHLQSEGGNPEPAAPEKATEQQAPEPKAPPAKASATQRVISSLPRSGSGVWSWAKEVEKVFEVKIIDGLINKAVELGFGRTTSNWDHDQTQIVCMDAVAYLRGVPNYAGQFDHLFADATPEPAKATEPVPAASGDYKADLAASKKQLMNVMQALVQKQLGRNAEKDELKAALATISPSVPNGDGHKGEVCESLNGCDDIKWITNMIQLVVKQVEMAQANAPDDEIPF